jgi:hypothetical protein
VPQSPPFALVRLGALTMVEAPEWRCYGRMLKKAGGQVVNDTDELIYELQDQVQRGNQMLARLCEKAGIDPAEAGRLPGEAVPKPVKAA